MADLILLPEFEEELDDSEREDPESWDAAAVLLEDFQDAQNLPTKVPIKDYHSYPGFEIKRFAAAVAQRYDIRIIKFLDSLHRLSKFRILVGYHREKDTFYALAYRSRDQAYDESPSSLGELFDRYRESGIPLLD